MIRRFLTLCAFAVVASASKLKEPDASDPAFRSPSLDLVEEVVKKAPLLKSQPLWNLISPNALHSGAALDGKLKDLDSSLEGPGQQLEAVFPDLRLRDLPVFCDLPKDVPRRLWSSTLEDVAMDHSGPPEDALPFHVRNTPLQDLRLEDLVLVGRRERVLRYREAVERFREQARETDFESVKVDKNKAISQLEQKSSALRNAYGRLHNDYSVERAETMEVKLRSDQDKDLIDKQQAVLDLQPDKEKQLQSIDHELDMKVKEKEEKLQEGKAREQKMQTVVNLKHHAELLLRQQVQALRTRADANRHAEATSENKAQATLAVVMKRVRTSSYQNKALLKRVEGTRKAILAEVEDKKRLEAGDSALLEQNKKLEKQNEQLEQLQSDGDAQRASLQREVDDGRAEHDRLQKEVDALEGARAPPTTAALLEDVDF